MGSRNETIEKNLEENLPYDCLYPQDHNMKLDQDQSKTDNLDLADSSKCILVYEQKMIQSKQYLKDTKDLISISSGSTEPEFLNEGNIFTLVDKSELPEHELAFYKDKRNFIRRWLLNVDLAIDEHDYEVLFIF